MFSPAGVPRTGSVNSSWKSQYMLYKCALKTIRKLGTSLTGKEHPKEENPLDTSCKGWNTSPAQGAVSALQGKSRTWFAQQEMVLMCSVHILLLSYCVVMVRTLLAKKAADSLTGPKGASSNRCSRKCAISVFVEIPLTVSQECEDPFFHWEIRDISTSQFWLSCYKNVKFK